MADSIFDVIGPIMVGPSSSHTAGANKIASIARRFISGKLVKVVFYLHGSFSKTFRGHGTDKALLGGILGFDSDDLRIRNSYNIADEMKLDYKFVHEDIVGAHPNTVKIAMTNNKDEFVEVIGKSVGGGAVRINEINGISVDFGGDYPTIITHHRDRKGILSEITAEIAKRKYNIATVNLSRSARGKDAFMIVECDEHVDIQLKNDLLEQIDGISNVFIINNK